MDQHAHAATQHADHRNTRIQRLWGALESLGRVPGLCRAADGRRSRQKVETLTDYFIFFILKLSGEGYYQAAFLHTANREAETSQSASPAAGPAYIANRCSEVLLTRAQLDPVNDCSSSIEELLVP